VVLNIAHIIKKRHGIGHQSRTSRTVHHASWCLRQCTSGS
jgi:hypothetical protein